MAEGTGNFDEEASAGRTFSPAHVDAIRDRLNRSAEAFDRVSALADEILEEME